MEQIQIYILLFGIIVLIGQIFNKSTIPISLLLVITGMLLSIIPGFPQVSLNPELVFNIFIPLLIYQISSSSSWVEVKKNIRPIGLLSIGHVIFITVLVAVVIHYFIPELGWPLAIVLGAIVSPPDDVAIVSIAEKIHMPQRVVTILEGEGLFNDAAALIIFRFSLAAIATHVFSLTSAIFTLFTVITCEILYGMILGYIIGELRLKINNSQLHIIASILTPFLAYFPAEILGGSGIIATAVTGFVIGNIYSTRFTPEFRLISLTIWPSAAFAIQSIVFLLVGLNLHAILQGISSIPSKSLVVYSIAVILAVIIGRFIWVFGAVYYLPRRLFPSILKKDPYPPWQYPFVISWAGMRGVISLAAALAIPILPILADGTNPRDLIIFLAFVVIISTLVVQGLTLPWILEKIGINKYGVREKYDEHLNELAVRMKMTNAVLRWLTEYQEQIKDDEKLVREVKLHLREYRMLKRKIKEIIKNHDDELNHDEVAEEQNEIFLLSQILEVERTTLLKLWHAKKISFNIKNKLLARLDHRTKHH